MKILELWPKVGMGAYLSSGTILERVNYTAAVHVCRISAFVTDILR